MACAGCAKRKAALLKVAGKVRDVLMPVKAPVRPVPPPPPKSNG